MIMRTVNESTLAEEIKFARKAAQYFANNRECHSFTTGDIEPGCLLALRWGLGKDCVLVLRLADDHVPSNYMELVTVTRPNDSGEKVSQTHKRNKTCVNCFSSIVNCFSSIPSASRVCSNCGHEFYPSRAKGGAIVRLPRDVTERDLRMPKFRDVDPDELEFRGDGKIVRKDRFKTGMRDIAAMFFYGDYEIPDVVAQVRFMKSLADCVIVEAGDAIWADLREGSLS